MKSKFIYIAGPCVIESRKNVLDTAGKLKSLAEKYGFKLIFKASFDKANRLSKESFRGVGIDLGLEILYEVKCKFNLPVTTDAHEPSQAKKIAEVADIIQIPAFLCRQTDLVNAAAETGKIVNIKKGQFLAPWDMGSIIKKIEHIGKDKIWITERGSCFGYNRLVVDMISLEYLKRFRSNVIFDATHSLQLPGGLGSSTGGQREFVFALTRAAAAVGINGIFAEVHRNPAKALSDSATMLDYKQFEALVKQSLRIQNISGGLV